MQDPPHQSAPWACTIAHRDPGGSGTPVLSDAWDGLDTLLVPGREILLPDGPDAVLAILGGQSEAERRRLGMAARAAILARHTAADRAAELERYLVEVSARRAPDRARTGHAAASLS